MLEELDGPLVFLGGSARPERPEVPSVAGLRIDLSRIEAILSRFPFAHHGVLIFHWRWGPTPSADSRCCLPPRPVAPAAAHGPRRFSLALAPHPQRRLT